MFAYCNNNPVNRYDPDGLCSRFLGFLWKKDCGMKTCSSSKNYEAPLPSTFESFLESMARPRVNGNTFSVGFTGSTAIGGVLARKTGVLSVDTSYNYAFQKTTTTGVTTGAGASAGVVLSFTNATNVNDLAGISESAGFTVAAPLGISLEGVRFVPASDPDRQCYGINIIIAFGAEVEIHSAQNYTISNRVWNPFLSLKGELYGN